MELNDAQRRIALGAVVAVVIAQIAAFEDKAAERAAWTLAILTIALLLMLAFAKPRPLPPEPEHRPIGFTQPRLDDKPMPA